MRRGVIAAPVVVLLAAGAGAQLPGAAVSFDRFIERSGPVCEREPARRCVDAGWRFADRDGDGLVSLAELRSIRAALDVWLEAKSGSLPPRERSLIILGTGMFDAAGLPALVGSFDADRDGALSRDELLADLRLDDRPLGAILQDPKAVDRNALARRLGVLAPLLGPLLSRPSR